MIILSEQNAVIEDRLFTGNIGAWQTHPDGRPYHTFRTASVLVQGNGTVFRRCTFENTAGPGAEAGQAIALYLDGDGIVLEDCVIRGHQDTLFLAPLPPTPYEKDGFLGPGEHLPRTERTVYFRRCLIEGGVDYVFGGATAYFDDCEFRSVEPGYVFAPSTPAHVAEGFVVRNCRFTAAPGLPDGSCRIARPWREYAALRLENCELGAHICPEGYEDWGRPVAGLRFVEEGSAGPGACPQARPAYVRILPGPEDAAAGAQQSRNEETGN